MNAPYSCGKAVAQSQEGHTTHFQIENFDITTLKEDEVLIQNQFLSLDPYMRSQIAGRHLSGTIKPGEMMRGETVGKIIDSKSTQFNAGDMVIGFGGWCY